MPGCSTFSRTLAKLLTSGTRRVHPARLGQPLIAGDAGGFVNSMRLKGIHLAMRTGMLAAESAFESVREIKFLWTVNGSSKEITQII